MIHRQLKVSISRFFVFKKKSLFLKSVIKIKSQTSNRCSMIVIHVYLNIISYGSLYKNISYNNLSSGIVKFHETNMSELETDYGEHSDTLSMRSVNFGSCSVLDQYVGHVRESMGIESHTQK